MQAGRIHVASRGSSRPTRLLGYPERGADINTEASSRRFPLRQLICLPKRAKTRRLVEGRGTLGSPSDEPLPSRTGAYVGDVARKKDLNVPVYRYESNPFRCILPFHCILDYMHRFPLAWWRTCQSHDRRSLWRIVKRDLAANCHALHSPINLAPGDLHFVGLSSFFFMPLDPVI